MLGFSLSLLFLLLMTTSKSGTRLSLSRKTTLCSHRTLCYSAQCCVRVSAQSVRVGPENTWLIEAYGASVQRPCGAIFAQELFESRLIPGETDYRIFRDYGKIPGTRSPPLLGLLSYLYLQQCAIRISNFGLPLFPLLENSHTNKHRAIIVLNCVQCIRKLLYISNKLQ